MPRIDKEYKKSNLKIGKRFEIKLDHYSNPLKTGDDYNIFVEVSEENTLMYKFIGFAEHLDEGYKHECSFTFDWYPQENNVIFYQNNSSIKGNRFRCTNYYHFLNSDHLIDYLFKDKPMQIN